MSSCVMGHTNCAGTTGRNAFVAAHLLKPRDQVGYSSGGGAVQAGCHHLVQHGNACWDVLTPATWRMAVQTSARCSGSSSSSSSQ